MTWKAYSIFNILVMLLLYALFLRLQTGQYAGFFSYRYAHRAGQSPQELHAESEAAHDPSAVRNSAALLVTGLVLIGVAVGSDGQDHRREPRRQRHAGDRARHAGRADLGEPEIMTALRAALEDRMQPVVNIALGASLSTVILTVPVIEAIALLSGQPIEMALTARRR